MAGTGGLNRDAADGSAGVSSPGGKRYYLPILVMTR